MAGARTPAAPSRAVKAQRTRTRRPDNWRELTRQPKGQAPRIFDTVRLRRPVPGSDPVRYAEAEVKVTDAICDMLRIGVPVFGSCESVGVTTTTYHSWRAKGAEDIKAGLASVYADFADASARAIAESQVVLVVEMRGHGKRDARATEYMLRNRFPKDFGERHRIEVAMAEDEIPDEVASRSIREAARQLEADNAIDVEGVAMPPGTAQTRKRNAKRGNGRNGHT